MKPESVHASAGSRSEKSVLYELLCLFVDMLVLQENVVECQRVEDKQPFPLGEGFE